MIGTQLSEDHVPIFRKCMELPGTARKWCRRGYGKRSIPGYNEGALQYLSLASYSHGLRTGTGDS